MGDCLLLHGFTGSPSAWNAVRSELPETLHAHTFFLPGHGGPLRAEACVSFEDAAARLIGQIAARALRRPRIVGYSMGARLALGVIILRPELFDGALLVGVHPGLGTDAERTARRESDARWVALLRTEGINAFADAWERQPLFASQATLPPEVTARERRMRRSHDPLQLALALERLGLAEMPDYRDRLCQLPMPVSLVVGERDPRFLALAESIVPQLRKGRLVVVPGCGHNVVLEHPAAVAACIASA